MKRFAIDTNFNYLGPCYPALSLTEVNKIGLKDGEKVIVFQDDDEWKGIVFYNKLLPKMYEWYVELQLENTNDGMIKHK